MWAQPQGHQAGSQRTGVDDTHKQPPAGTVSTAGKEQVRRYVPEADLPRGQEPTRRDRENHKPRVTDVGTRPLTQLRPSFGKHPACRAHPNPMGHVPSLLKRVWQSQRQQREHGARTNDNDEPEPLRSARHEARQAWTNYTREVPSGPHGRVRPRGVHTPPTQLDENLHAWRHHRLHQAHNKHHRWHHCRREHPVACHHDPDRTVPDSRQMSASRVSSQPMVSLFESCKARAS